MNCSFGSEDSVCGPFGANSTILLLVKCEEDMTSHLISLGVSSKRGRRSIPTLSESNLILNRAGLFGLGLQRTGEMTICPKHRRELRVDWAGRKSSTCSYPSYRGPRKQMKNVRRIFQFQRKYLPAIKYPFLLALVSSNRYITLFYLMLNLR